MIVNAKTHIDFIDTLAGFPIPGSRMTPGDVINAVVFQYGFHLTLPCELTICKTYTRSNEMESTHCIKIGEIGYMH